MSCILCIETSTTVCSVAVISAGNVLFSQHETEGPFHSSVLGVFADNAVKFVERENLKLDAVAVSCGPGSYTGLRIGVSEAKGICFGLDIPLIAINTLLVLAFKVAGKEEFDEEILFCPMIDARRMEVYAAIYDRTLELQREIRADIVDENTYLEFLQKGKVAFFGNGAAKCKEIISHPNAVFLDDIHPLASDMGALAEEYYNNKNFVDVAYFEPFYLKEFVATTPKNKVF